MSSFYEVRFPGEPDEYRVARNELSEEEWLRSQITATESKLEYGPGR
jgi:hypothetical protein